ncbi:Fe-S cluster assembly protein SufD [Fructilactobacillus frigidiflavus]|uniref:Fe-S cluster assembly protein SufD n=1 Tax=Fructilactobacillus frigidiflavus TaxID=3242688 RepID=UPI00375721BD
MARDKFMAQLDANLVNQAAFVNEPQWMTDLRINEFNKLADEALPRVDKIKYQSWKVINQKVTSSDAIATETFTVTEEMQAAEVVICDFETALTEHEDLLKPYLEKICEKQTDRLTSLNFAALNQGTFIYVPKNVELKTPINITTTQHTETQRTLFDRIVIVGDVNSHFDVVHSTQSQGNAKTIAHLSADVFAKTGSKIQFFGMDATASNTTSFIMRHAWASKHATMNWMIGALNDGNTVADFMVDLDGEGSVSDSRVVGIANGRQQQGINTRLTNFGVHSDAQIDQRGAILDKAKIVFNGIGKVQHGAHNANNQQQNHVLMLSDEASGDANPILLINEHDVVAGHAASIGRIDEKQLYYLMSRGLSKTVAEKLVIRGFLGIILAQIPSKTIRDQMVTTIERKLDHERPTP